MSDDPRWDDDPRDRRDENVRGPDDDNAPHIGVVQVRLVREMSTRTATSSSSLICSSTNFFCRLQCRWFVWFVSVAQQPTTPHPARLPLRFLEDPTARGPDEVVWLDVLSGNICAHTIHDVGHLVGCMPGHVLGKCRAEYLAA
jgi:hypothetical protein